MCMENNNYGELMPEMKRKKPHLPEISTEHGVHSRDFGINVKKEIERCFPLMDNNPEKKEEAARFFAEVIVGKCTEQGEINHVMIEDAYESLLRIKKAVGLEENKFIDEIIIHFQDFS